MNKKILFNWFYKHNHLLKRKINHIKIQIVQRMNLLCFIISMFKYRTSKIIFHLKKMKKLSKLLEIIQKMKK